MTTVQLENAWQTAAALAMVWTLACGTRTLHHTSASGPVAKWGCYDMQELSDAADVMAEGSLLGPLDRQRRLRWAERLQVTQPSLPTQVTPSSLTVCCFCKLSLHLLVPGQVVS